MNLYAKTRQFISLKLRRVPFKSAAQCLKQPLTDSDYYILVMIACIAGIIVTLRFAEYIDSLQTHADVMRQAAEFNQQEAIHAQATIASMLNGAVVINGRTVTLCQLNAAGECK